MELSKKEKIEIIENAILLIRDEKEDFICGALRNGIWKLKEVRTALSYEDALNLFPEVSSRKPSVLHANNGIAEVYFDLDEEGRISRITLLQDVLTELNQ